MKIEELIEELQEVARTDPGAEVRIATQPNYPMQSNFGGICTENDLAGNTQCEEHGDYSCALCHGHPSGIVWLLEGSSVYDQPYAPRGLWDAK